MGRFCLRSSRREDIKREGNPGKKRFLPSDKEGVVYITNTEFVGKLTDLANNYRTKYMWGTFGSLISSELIRQKVAQYPNNYSTERQNVLENLSGQQVWAFDCVGLIKGILWGWRGSVNETYGGAVYASVGVPDTTADGLFRLCGKSGEVSENLPVGSVLSLPGHIGVYAGNRRVIEATLGRRGDGVVFSDLADAGWRGSALLPWIEYPGSPSGADPSVIRRYLTGQNVGDSIGEMDLDGDGKVTVKDLLLAQRKNSPAAVPGSVVRIKPGARVYGKSYGFASFVYDTEWIVKEVNGDRAVIDSSADGGEHINSPVSVQDLILTGNR